MAEKTYFDNNKIRITNLRLDFKNETIPIDHISEVKVRFKVFNVVISGVCFLLSIFTYIFLMSYIGQLGLLILALFFIWFYKTFSSYVELWLVVEDEEIFIFHTSLFNCKYIYSIEDSIKEAMYDNQLAKNKGELEYTDTMKFKLRLKEYE